MKAIHPQRSSVILEEIPHEDTTLEIPTGFKDADGEEIQHYPRWRVVATGPGKLLDDGREIPILLDEGDEVVVDPRFAVRLEPVGFFDGRKLICIDYAGVLVKVEREPGEKVSRFAIPQPKQQPQAPPILVPRSAIRAN